MQKLLSSTAFCAGLIWGAGAMAQESLTFATTLPDKHPLVSGFLEPWVENVNAASEGELEINLRNGPMLANHTNVFDRVGDDVAQIGWGLAVNNPGRFSRMLVATLPFMFDTAEEGSLAVCLMWQKGEFAEQLDGLIPLVFATFPQASIHTNGKPINSIEDLKGLRIITSGPAVAAIIENHGGVPLSFPINEQYEALQRGTADGTVINFTAFPAFRLGEVTANHYLTSLGSVPGMIFISRAAYDGLSQKAKDALAANSGCDLSRQFGAFIDQWEAGAREAAVSEGSRTVVTASPDEIARLKSEGAQPMRAGFSQTVPGGDKLIDAFEAAVEEARSSN